MLVNFGVAITVRKVTAETPEDIKEMVNAIRNPKGSSEAHTH